MPGPPRGVRIVDRMTMLSGSWATMFLADQKIPADRVFFDRF
jgi:crotonobetainyl-CoA:carnitine CoA-transferase CaiB-like acyl-CoA transferase